MQAFKLNLKIIWKRLPILSIYLVTFIVISILIANATSSEPTTPDLFEPTKIDGVFFAEEDTPITRGLYEEMEKTVNFKSIENDSTALTDALYWGDIQYVVRIPEGFTEALLAGDESRLERTAEADSYFSVYTDMAIDKYLTAASLYADFSPELTATEMADLIRDDLSETVEISVLDEERSAPVYGQYFYNYMSYAVLAILILGMGTLMFSFKDPELKRRNTAAPQPERSQVLGFVFANLCFGLATWLIFVIASLILDSENAGSVQTRWFIINSLVFTLSASALSFMIGALIKKPTVIDAVSNVVSLGTAFISGTFVPQAFLAAGVLAVAKLTPVYWYILANNRIAALGDFTSQSLMTVWQPMAIVLGFAVLFILISIIAMKRHRYAY